MVFIELAKRAAALDAAVRATLVRLENWLLEVGRRFSGMSFDIL